MKPTILIVAIMVMTAPAFGQTFDADGNRLDSGIPKTAPNSALYAVQNRNAAVFSRVIDQTPEYQDGYALRAEAVKQREASARQTATVAPAPVPAPASGRQTNVFDMLIAADRESSANIRHLTGMLGR